MHMGVLSVRSLVKGLQDTVRVPYRFHKVHVRAPEGPLWIPYGHGNIRTVPCECRAGFRISVRSVVRGLTGTVGPASA